ncbi:hypothetical protein FACS1894105_06290 [Clostridia bacterium]|nr:hypothetical protein FACS1894105_06290 [Clostridia bacterium]
MQDGDIPLVFVKITQHTAYGLFGGFSCYRLEDVMNRAHIKALRHMVRAGGSEDENGVRVVFSYGTGNLNACNAGHINI